VDLYYLHSPPDDPEKINRILDLYEGFKQEGRIRAIGASIKGPNVTRQTVDLCRQYIQTGRVDVLQVIYSIFRQKNAEMFREAAENGVGIVVRTALESGFLTGKYVPGHEFTGNDHRKRWGNKHLNYILQHAEVLKQSSVQPPYKTLSQVAIRFALSPREISTVIVGAKSVGQAENNLSVAALPALDPRIQTRLVETYRDLNETFNTRG
jgi:myo-inositol catabolism protein IolS